MINVRVKICGITRLEDAWTAASAGVDAIGLMFYRESPRYISPEAAASLVQSLPPFLQTVGVFVNESAEEIRRIAALCSLGAVQLHGDETPHFCLSLSGLRVIKAFRVRGPDVLSDLARYRTQGWLLDAYTPGQRGGTGEVFNWEIAAEATRLGVPVVVAGGLNPQNVAKAIRSVRPYGVDLSSGVESAPGIKNAEKIQALMSEIRGAL